MSLAQRERADLVSTLSAVGESAPTLCGDWTARDLASHLVVRERRLDAAPGILLPFLAGYTEQVQNRVAQRPFTELVDAIASGPPIWSPFKILDPVINVGEMFVHHEDLRRAVPGWDQRVLSAAMESKLWSTASMIGRLAYRGAGVGVTLRTTDGRSAAVTTGRGRSVVLTGTPSELLLHAFGRSEVVLDADGDDADVQAVQNLDRSF
ncbi:TIGR03085 family metal-binding protein [Rhodococcoides kyotonense]|uniref:TIGR03085 family protein n=1 Tax=Rhodococcoides kyotonense TaxID=398843 RepID=A0A239D2C3_9NOCA|nr:TIGR03085 family metal-binding protein [Rhodococcus kyotonensis]SNS26565.1 TIGR03085 family protein [Rhodococcus kyotonensis]